MSSRAPASGQVRLVVWALVLAALCSALTACSSEDPSPVSPESDAQTADTQVDDAKAIDADGTDDVADLDAFDGSADGDAAGFDVVARDGTPPADRAVTDAPVDRAEAAADVVVDAGPPSCVIGATFAYTPRTAGTRACGTSAMRALALPMDRVMGTMVGTSPTFVAPCARRRGPEQYFPLHVVRGTGVELRASSSYMDPVLSIRTDCGDALSTFECSDDEVSSETTAALRVALAPGDYWVVVGSNTTDGSIATGAAYTLDLRAFDVAPNATCEHPIAITQTCALRDQDFDRGLGSQWCNRGGSTLFYDVEVPASAEVTVTVTPHSFRTPIILRNVGCPAECGSYYTGEPSGNPATVTFTNRGTSATTEHLAIFSRFRNERMIADITSTSTHIDVAAHARCSTPLTVTSGTTFRDDLALAADGFNTTTCERSATAFAHGYYYRATIPAGQTLFASSVGETAPSMLMLLDSCAATMCSAAARESRFGATLAVPNTGTTPRDVLFTVVGSGPALLTIAMLPSAGARGANSVCASAEPLYNGLTASIAAPGTDRLDALCAPSARGGVRFYRAVVPAGLALSIRADGPAGESHTVRFLDRCGATSCLDSVTAARSAQAVFSNHGSTPREVVIAAGGESATSAGPYGVTAALGRPMPNATCATALSGFPLSLRGQDTRFGLGLNPCASPPEYGLFYSVTVPAGYELHAFSIDPGAPVHFGVLRSCDATTCLATSTAMSEPVVWTNTSSAPVSVIVVVSTRTFDAGPYEFSITAGPHVCSFC